MTVKELITKLQQIKNQESRVVIRGVDPTDWTYPTYNDINDVENSLLVDGDGVYEIDQNDIDKHIDDNFEPVVIIDGGMF